MEFPKRFKERYSSLVDDPEKLFATLLKPLDKSFRVNTLKSNIKEVQKRFKEYGIKIQQVPWYKEAFVTKELRIGETLEHFLGYIYNQEITSMLPVLILKKELEKATLVLDACAAPGSKTTQMAGIIGNRGLIVANDLIYKRIKALKFNIERIGALNILITNKDLTRFPDIKFDVVLLDAPCSSEGRIRKDYGVLSTWSERTIKENSKIQKKLILKAYDLLNENGTLVYSTCTFAPEENEEVVNYLLNKTNAKLMKINIPKLKTSSGITKFEKKEYNKEVSKAIRIWPHQNDTGGFFIAKIKK